MENHATPMVEYASIAAVQKAVGFQVLMPQGFSGHVKKIFLIGGKVVHLELSNGLSYRMAKGTDDISGDWTAYPDEKIETVDKYTVTEKGVYGKVFSAAWTDGEFTFTLHTPYGISAEGLSEMIESLGAADAALPSPIVKYDYIFEAEYAVGFGILVPTNIHSSETFRGVCVISGQVAQVEYANDIVYRMARGLNDISGVYKQFGHSDAFSVGKYHVLAKGGSDRYYVTLWNDGKFSFSLYCPHGITRKEIEEFIGSLCLIN